MLYYWADVALLEKVPVYATALINHMPMLSYPWFKTFLMQVIWKEILFLLVFFIYYTLCPRMVHPSIQKVKQKWQDACMDEQGAPDWTQTSKGSTQEVAAWRGDLGGIQQRCLEHAHTGLGKPKLTWSWMWWGIWRATKRASRGISVTTQKKPQNN